MGNYVSGAPKDSGGNPIPASWTDDPLVQDVTPIKKTHIVELRACLAALDGHYHVFNGNNSNAELPDVAVAWAESNAQLIVDETPPKAAHTNEIIGFIKSFDGH